MKNTNVILLLAILGLVVFLILKLSPKTATAAPTATTITTGPADDTSSNIPIINPEQTAAERAAAAAIAEAAKQARMLARLNEIKQQLSDDERAGRITRAERLAAYRDAKAQQAAGTLV